jgi:hypothetical protein
MCSGVALAAPEGPPTSFSFWRVDAPVLLLVGADQGYQDFETVAFRRVALGLI